MSFDDTSSLYDILDIKPDASPQEVREAYLKTKAAYNKDSVALYTLITPDEREEMLARIQEAYEVLSNVEKRRDYDRHHGVMGLGGEHPELSSPARAPVNKKIISIDRVAPMESSANSENLLVAPTTDFTTGPKLAAVPAPADPFTNPGAEKEAAPQEASPAPAAAPAQPSAPAPVPSPVAAATRSADHALNQEIAQEVEWKGSFLRRVREGRRMSIEELSNITKVSKTYLQAIEEENFSKLPAPVFLRGFITQMAKTLRVPHEAVVAAYMARFHQARPDKTGR